MSGEELIVRADRVRPLEWSDPAPPGDGCHYNHCKAETPFGRLHIDWKSWKAYPSYSLECLGNYVGSFSTLEEAKEAAAAWYTSGIERSSIRTEPPADVVGLVERLNGTEPRFCPLTGKELYHIFPNRDGPEAAATLTTQAREIERAKTDTGRLLWRDDVESVCPTIESCFEYGETVRCGPCAVKAALQSGVEPDYSLPALPEVSRLKREVDALQKNLELRDKFIVDHALWGEFTETTRR